MKSYLILFVAFSITTFLSGCSKEDEEDILAKLDLPDEVVFSHLPTDLSEMLKFTPIGEVLGIPKSHGGFRLLNPYSFPPQVPVYAICDGYIIGVEKKFRTVTGDDAPQELKGLDYDDYSFDFAVSKTAVVHYAHVSALAPHIVEEIGEMERQEGFVKRVKVKVNAGDVIGYVGPHYGVDLGMWDFKVTNYFVNPSRYSERYISTVSWTDYLPQALQEQVWKINERVVEPRGGKIDYDVAGTISGNWFRPGAKSITEWSKQLVIDYHQFYGERITIADLSPLLDDVGILSNNQPLAWWIKGNSPAPETIKPASGPVKYAVAPYWFFFNNIDPEPLGTVMIEMTSENSLLYEYFESKKPEEVKAFTNNVRDYIR